MEECIDDAMGAALGPFRAAFLLFVSCYCFEAAGLQVNKDKNQLGLGEPWSCFWSFAATLAATFVI